MHNLNDISWILHSFAFLVLKDQEQRRGPTTKWALPGAAHLRAPRGAKPPSAAFEGWGPAHDARRARHARQERKNKPSLPHLESFFIPFSPSLDLASLAKTPKNQRSRKFSSHRFAVSKLRQARPWASAASKRAVFGRLSRLEPFFQRKKHPTKYLWRWRSSLILMCFHLIDLPFTPKRKRFGKTASIRWGSYSTCQNRPWTLRKMVWWTSWRLRRVVERGYIPKDVFLFEVIFVSIFFFVVPYYYFLFIPLALLEKVVLLRFVKWFLLFDYDSLGFWRCKSQKKTFF